MYKVLVVDDEQSVCKGIFKLIDWQKHGFICEASAQNGAEALDMVKKEHFDVILTDIRMPEIDGLELIQKLSAMNYDGKIVVMSAYREFEYAQSAVKFGAKNYLTKPISETELIKTCDKIKEELDAEGGVAASIAISDAQINAAYRKFAIKVNLKGELDKLRKCIYKSDQAGITACISSILQKASEEKEDSEIMSGLFVCIFQNLATIINSMYDSEIVDEENYASTVRKIKTTEELKELMVKSCFKLSEQLSAAETGRGGNTIDEIKQYITQRYNENINLVSISKVYFMNPVYLGRLFKSKVGVSFTDFLNNLRIQKAEELLRQDACMIYEIAEKVGYKDLNYFYKKFKMKNGVTPTEYKNRLKSK